MSEVVCDEGEFSLECVGGDKFVVFALALSGERAKPLAAVCGGGAEREDGNARQNSGQGGVAGLSDHVVFCQSDTLPQFRQRDGGHDNFASLEEI